MMAREPSAGSRPDGSAMMQHSLVAVARALRPVGIGAGQAMIAQAFIIAWLALIGQVIHGLRPPAGGFGGLVHHRSHSCGYQTHEVRNLFRHHGYLSRPRASGNAPARCWSRYG